MPIFYTDSGSINDLEVTGSVRISGSLTLTSQAFNTTGSLFGTASFANTASTVVTNTVSYTAGAGLSGGGSAILGGSSVTIDAVAGAGISLTLPTNDAININTGSTHFISGARSTISVLDTSGANGIDLTYDSGTGVLSGTLVTSTFNVGAGSGLTGGGSANLGATSTVNVGAGLGITVNADDIALDTASAHFTNGVKTRLNTEGVISSSTQFNNLTSPLTGSFTGSFIGALTGTGSWSVSSSRATTASFAISASWAPGGAGTVTSITAGDGLTGGTITSTGTITIDTGSTHFISGSIGVLNNKTIISSSGQVNGANITNNTVSYTAGAGLSGGGSATLGGGSVTIDAVAGAGILLTAPTNDAINIDTGSVHFTGGVKTKLNTDGVVSSSGQFISLTAPFTGSFTGSFSGSLDRFSPVTLRVTVGTTAPSSPAVNDLWVDTN